MDSFPDGFRALIVGASGTIGSAFTALLKSDTRCAFVAGIHRQSQPPIDFSQESTIATAAAKLTGKGPFHLVINARTDSFYTSSGSASEKLSESIQRGNKYREAGADCIFIQPV